MRWPHLATIVLGLAWSLPPSGAGEDAPLHACRLEPDAGPLGRMETTGIGRLDTRVKAERNFLEMLFRVKANLLLLDAVAPRDACVRTQPDGSLAVAFKAHWLRERCWERPHRNALVAAALAHQYAHLLQAKKGCTLPEMARELHADLLTGWFLGKRNFGTLESGETLDAAFAASLFDVEDPHLNTRYEHGSREARIRAVSEGFRLFRAEKASLSEVYAKGLEMFPPPKVGFVGPPPEGLENASGVRFRREKIACTHKGPCSHRIPCQHPQPCVHKVACAHLEPCVHRTPCVHRVECRHHVACVHRTPCTHKVPCVHTTPCVHRMHSYDLEHEYDIDFQGNRAPCTHQVPCRHFRHRFDYLHNFDYEHDYDYEHQYDTEHEFDYAHEYDTEHEGDPIHEFDMAHDWDPVHEFDLAHEWDPAHDYDIRMVPEGE